MLNSIIWASAYNCSTSTQYSPLKTESGGQCCSLTAALSILNRKSPVPISEHNRLASIVFL